MSWLSDLLKADGKSVLGYLFLASALIIPGATYIFRFDRVAALTMNSVSLILYAITISVPLMLVAIIGIAALNRKELESQPTRQWAILFGASVWVLVAFFVSMTVWSWNNASTDSFLVIAYTCLGIFLIIEFGLKKFELLLIKCGLKKFKR